MDIEILSVKNKDDFFELKQRREEIAHKLYGLGFFLTYVNPIDLNPKKIIQSLNETAQNPEKPEIVIIANALSAQGAKSFKKKFASVVAVAEKAEFTPAPKDYWKKRDAAFKRAKKARASREEMAELTERFRLYRKKSKIFSLGDLGNGCKGYCFMFKGIKVAVLPQAVLAGVDIRDMILLAAVRTREVFENSAQDYPGGFSLKEYVPPKTGFTNRFIPKKGDGGKEIFRKSVVMCSFLVFLAALTFLAYNVVFLSVQNDSLNGEIQKIYYNSDISDDNGEEIQNSDTKNINWNELKKINEDIIGWIQIDNTKIDYPVLWCKTDNSKSQYYLKHNYKGASSSFGSIFLDYRCTEGTKSKNTVLHGHHMNDGSMFANLLKYGKTTGDLDFYKKSPIITYNTPEGNATYKIISVFKTNTLSEHGEFFNYMVGNFQNDKDFMNYVYNVRIRSLINCPVDVNEDDTLLTLSTCSYEFTNFRTVVVARKVRDGESEKVDLTKASLNKNAVWPQVYYNRYGGKRPEVTDFCTAYDKGQIDWYNGDYDFKDQEVKETKPAETEEEKKSESSSASSSSAAASSSSQEKIYLTVTFINYDGSLISTQKVEYGKAAKAPKDPTKPSTNTYDFVFKGWQLDFSKVTSNMTIAPTFEAVEKATE